MPQGPAGWALVVAVALFVVFVLVKSRLALTAGGERGEGRRRLTEAKQHIRDARGDPTARAQALREASEVALNELGRPNLAASFARRAERVDPGDTRAVGMLALAMRRASRYRALEKMLWRRLAEDPASAVYERAFDELIALYEGPLRRPAQAQVLSKLRAQAEDGASG